MKVCRAFPPLPLLGYSASLAVASPVLSHLTSAVSSNTIHTAAAVLLAASVLLYDYVSCSVENRVEHDVSRTRGDNNHRENGDTHSTPSVPVSDGVVSTSPSCSRISAWSASSLNAAMFAATCLASRVDNATDAFALLWAATALLAVWPHARDSLSTGLHGVTNGFIAGAIALALGGVLLRMCPALGLWYAALTVLIWIVMPGVYVSLLPLKR